MSNKNTVRRSGIFLLVGGFNTLVDFCVYTLLIHILPEGPSQIAIVGILSGSFALILAFFTHSLFTWKDRHIGALAIVKFFVITGIGMWIIRPLLLVVFVYLSSLLVPVDFFFNNFGVSISQSFIINTSAFLLMTLVMLVYNYLAYDRIVFSKKTISDTDNKNR